MIATPTPTPTPPSSPTADLSVTKKDGKRTVSRGEQTTYTIVVTNNGPDGVTGARVTDFFPSKVTGVTYTATSTGGATGFTPAGSGNINDRVDMPVGSTITYEATGTVSMTAREKIPNRAIVTAPAGTNDPQLRNNRAGDIDTVTP
ncbi:hypothetical protein BH20VER3_BH20VER3_03840 [soil metagenome]